MKYTIRNEKNLINNRLYMAEKYINKPEDTAIKKLIK